MPTAVIARPPFGSSRLIDWSVSQELYRRRSGPAAANRSRGRAAPPRDGASSRPLVLRVMPRVGRVQATEEARSYGRRASLLSIGVGLTGLITYLYFVIASHELSKDAVRPDRGALVGGLHHVSILQRPVEQLLSRTSPSTWLMGTPIRQPMRVAATIQLSVAVVFAVARAGPARRRIQDDLLHGNETLYWIFFAAVIVYGASYFARGFLAGSHRLTDLRAPDHLRVGLPDGVPARRWRSASPAARRRSRSASSPPPPSPDRRPVRLPAPRRKRGSDAAPADGEAAEVHGDAGPTRRVHPRRGGGFAAAVLADHVQRADLPQRRALLVNAQRRAPRRPASSSTC